MEKIPLNTVTQRQILQNHTKWLRTIIGMHWKSLRKRRKSLIMFWRITGNRWKLIGDQSAITLARVCLTHRAYNSSSSVPHNWMKVSHNLWKITGNRWEGDADRSRLPCWLQQASVLITAGSQCLLSLFGGCGVLRRCCDLWQVTICVLHRRCRGSWTWTQQTSIIVNRVHY